ncbi:MAG: ribonuclease Z [Deltaproteobacteria bacterium]|nr:ribonuclease Z [Deltaproteobacteria bacterium]
MSSRALVVLGTASQVPTRRRNQNGYFVRWDEVGFLVDPGEGTQRQMILAGVRASRIHHICITHFHGDHCLGLAGVIQRISLDDVPHEVYVHYPASGEQYFQRLRRASIFKDRSRLVPRPFTGPGVVFATDQFVLSTDELSHTVPTYGFRIQEPDGMSLDRTALTAAGLKGPVVGQLVREGKVTVDGRTVCLEDVSTPRPGQSLAIVMDTRPCEGAVRLARSADLLVCESTYLQTEVHEAWERGHMTAGQAARLAVDASARKLVLSHFSQRHPDETVFLEEAQPIFPDCIAAEDCMVIPVPKRART